MKNESSFQVTLLPCLQDNYIFVIHADHLDQVIVVDPAEASPVIEFCQATGKTVSTILNTHHHHDHIGGNLALKKKYGCMIYGANKDQHRLPGVDHLVSDGDKLLIESLNFLVLETPGHTLGHIVYYESEQKWLFCGDTLFSAGCGRLFEGSPEQMFASLEKIKNLPEDTQIFCAHEYTLANIDFALSVEGQNQDLLAYREQVSQWRSSETPSIPTQLALEKRVNPFLRWESESLRESIGLRDSSPLEIFTELRRRKDQF